MSPSTEYAQPNQNKNPIKANMAKPAVQPTLRLHEISTSKE